MCWERGTWRERSLAKQVRNLGTYSIELTGIVHRLVHDSIAPPAVPNTETLLEMRALAPYGLQTVMDRLDDPIVESFEHQLIVGSIAPARARQKIENGDYLIYGARKTRVSNTPGSIGGVTLPYAYDLTA